MGRTAKLLGALGVLALAAGSPAPLAAADGQGKWSTKAAMPAPREDIGTVVLDGKIYAIGGTAGRDAQITRNEVYDPATDKWTARAPLPRGSHHLAVALLNGSVYTFGGFTGPAHSAPVDYAYEYDPKTDAWRT